MEKPNIIALPTSQMQALCDVLGLGKKVQESTASMVKALEAADFSKLEVVKSQPGVPRPANTIGYELAELGKRGNRSAQAFSYKVDRAIVAQRKADLGRT